MLDQWKFVLELTGTNCSLLFFLAVADNSFGVNQVPVFISMFYDGWLDIRVDM